MITASRIRGILLEPRSEWPKIDAEPATPASLYSGWIAPLAAIGPIASLIGLSVFGISLPFAGRYVVPLGTGIMGAVWRYIMALVGCAVIAIVIDKLAPSFGATSNRIGAWKVAAYSSTAAWLAGIFGIFPPLAILGLVGLYSIFLLYLGLMLVMKAPAQRAVGYTVVVVLVAIVFFVVVGVVSTILLRMGRLPTAM